MGTAPTEHRPSDLRGERCEPNSSVLPVRLSFFDSGPEGILKSSSTTATDSACRPLLGRCRAALPVQGRLLVVEPPL